MPTITSKELVDELIRNDGYYKDDLRVVKIVQYNDKYGPMLAWGIIYEGHDLDYYRSSQYVRNPKTIWEARPQT